MIGINGVKMKVKVKRIVKFICFCMIGVLIINALSALFKPKWLENRWQSAKTNNSFYELEKDSTEVLFFGSSVIAAAVDPYQLYNEQGISSYNLGVMSQPILATYFWLKEAVKTQDIKLAVVEIKSAGRDKEKEVEKARKSYDYMREGKTKLQYAIEYNNVHKDDEEVQLWDYLFPLSIYHSRWSELTYEDYDFFLGNDDSYTRGFSTLTTEFKDASNFDNEEYENGEYDGIEIDTDEIEDVNSVNEAYAKRLIKFAKEEGIELLFIRTPDTKWSTEQHNSIKKLTEENDVGFLDFNLKEMRKKLGFDYAVDAADTVHLNLNGAVKFTTYLGKYLSQHYDLNDYRQGDNSVKKAYESEMDNYNSVMKASKLSMITNADEYLEAINDDEYAVFIVSGSKAGKLKFTDAQRKSLAELGVEDGFFKEAEYGKNIIFIKDGKTITNNIKEQNDAYTKSVSSNGTLSCKTDYSISANVNGCSVRFNNSEYQGIVSAGFNIVVYNKKLNNIADSVYLYAEDANLILDRQE